jgi:hypothetical protein
MRATIPWQVASGLVLLLGCSGDGDALPPRPVPHPRDDTLRLNHLQAKGTHNSYHVETTDGFPVEWNYTHAPLAEQLADQGVRKLELDTWYSVDEGVHHVFHAPLVDEGTVCDLLVDCLADIKGWSDYNPGHHPLFIQIEPKNQDAYTPDVMISLLETMEEEILSVFPGDRLILPDDVQGEAATLAEAIDTVGWPTLGEVRGKVLFFLDCERSLCIAYASDGAGLQGRLAFSASEPGDAFEAVRVINNPETRGDDIVEAVGAGRIVRTMVDNVPSALENDTNLQAGLDSGAHMLSSDVPVPRDDTDYVMEIPGGTPSRCNPISAPADCTSTDIEDPALLAGAP